MPKENLFFFAFPNRKSSESHNARIFGRVAFEVDAVNESSLDRVFANIPPIPPSSLKTPVFIRGLAREVSFRNLPYNLPLYLPSVRRAHVERPCSRQHASAFSAQSPDDSSPCPALFQTEKGEVGQEVRWEVGREV